MKGIFLLVVILTCLPKEQDCVSAPCLKLDIINCLQFNIIQVRRRRTTEVTTISQSRLDANKIPGRSDFNQNLDSEQININDMSEIETFNLESAHEHMPPGIATYRREVC